MQCPSTPSTDVQSGQSSAPSVQWADALQSVPDPRHPGLGPSVPQATDTEWHTLDGSLPDPSWLSLQYPSSPESYSTSPPSSRASSPRSSSGSPRPKKKSVSRRSAKDPSHIPRPRNAFILFRSDKCQQLRESNVETDHRMISRIMGALWHDADPATKKHYQDLAAEEKEEHARLHPEYRFNPKARAAPPKRRKVKRNGATDRQRCKLIADILRMGNNTKLKQVIDEFDKEIQDKLNRRQAARDPGDVYTTAVFDLTSSVPSSTPPLTSSSTASTCSETPFRSPLLPPAPPPSAMESHDFATGGQPDVLSALSPEDPVDVGSAINATQLPETNVMEDMLYVQTPNFPSTATGFGAIHSQEQGIVGVSNMYPPRLPQFDPVPPTQHYHFQDGALFSVDPSFHQPSYTLDVGAQIPAANLEIGPYQAGFQSVPQLHTQPHPHAQYGINPLAYTASYDPEFGIQAVYPAVSEALYPMQWPTGLASGLESSVQAESAHLGVYMPSF